MSGLTYDDLASAMAFADNQIALDICKPSTTGQCDASSEISKIVCPETSCAAVKKTFRMPTWQPVIIDTNKAAAEDVALEITQQDICTALSNFPFPDNSCTFKKPTKTENGYYEWHVNAGVCDTNRSCMDDNDCSGTSNMCFGAIKSPKKMGSCRVNGNGQSCSGNQTCNAKGECEGCTNNSECPGSAFCVISPGKNGFCSQDSGMCVMGNSVLRQYCENVSCRCAQGDRSCEATLKKAGGGDDVPPFKYHTEDGSCTITKDYCAWFGGKYTDGLSGDSPRPCTSDVNCPQNYSCVGGACSGKDSSCTVPATQDAAQFVIGKTLYAAFFADSKAVRERCRGNIFNNSSQVRLPDEVAGACHSLIRSLRETPLPPSVDTILPRPRDPIPMCPHYAGGMTVYGWELEDGGRHIGFLPDEMLRAFPNACTDTIQGVRFRAELRDTGSSPGLKRVYTLVCAQRSLISSIFGK